MKSKSFPYYAQIGVILIVASATAWSLGLFQEGITFRTLPQIMAVAMSVGIAALMVGLHRLCLGSFALSGTIAYFLLQWTLPLAGESHPHSFAASAKTFSIEQYSTSNMFNDGTMELDLLINSRADVISIHGLTPDWAEALADSLRQVFPSQYLFPDIGLHGLGLFAREAFGSVDSLFIHGIVHVRACHQSLNADQSIQILAVQTSPPLSTGSYLNLQAQLGAVSSELQSSSIPTILIGDFNAVPWSPELNTFTASAGVSDSRRCQMPSYSNGMPALFEAPLEHIFYTRELRCVKFETLRSQGHYLGNRASFQSTSQAPTVVAL